MNISEGMNSLKTDIPESIMTKVASFPSMPQSATKLRILLKRKDVKIHEIENILRQDPGLSTNVLRLANSAHFCLSSKVRSLKQAVMLLGIKRFEHIAMSASMGKIMDKAVVGYDLSPGKLWLHSIAVSTTAEALSKFLKISNSNDFFTPALLHDMGKLILGKFVEKESEELQRYISKGDSLTKAEYKVLGTDHAEIGALILEKWSFPSDIVDAVRWHHEPDYISETLHRLKTPSRQADIVYLSNFIIQSNNATFVEDENLCMPSDDVLKRLGINIEQYIIITQRALKWNDSLSNTLSFE